MQRAHTSLLVLPVLAACGSSGPPPERPPRVVDERFQDFEAGSQTREPERESGGSSPEPSPVREPDLAQEPAAVETGTVEPASNAPGVVARLELALPERERFVLHGTVPVPAGALAWTLGRSPLAVVSHRGGGEIPAQVEVVSRRSTGEPDVVAVLAVVERGAGEQPGQRVRFDVVHGDYEAPAAPLGELPAEPILLRSRDPFGHTYAVDLRGGAENGSERILSDGGVQQTRRVYGTQVCVAPTERGPVLPHLLGVHAYWTQRAGDERISLDLRVNNGATAGSREHSPLESPLGIVYWDALELVVPKRYRVESLFNGPYRGNDRVEGEQRIVRLVRRPGPGKLHMMPPQAWMIRRVVLVPEDEPASEGSERPQPERPGLEGLAFCVKGEGLWSWWSDATANYFAQRSLLASWSGPRQLRTQLRGERSELARLVARGRADGNQIVSLAMGWSHPWFVSVQGGTGGVGIQALEGHRTAAAGSRDGYERLLLLHRMNASRQASAQWNAAGDPVGYHLWLNQNDRVPFDYRTNGRMVPPTFKLPMFGGRAASAQVLAAHEGDMRPLYDQGTPHLANGEMVYDDSNLFNWWPHDGQHMIRYTKNPKALVWLGNDALAKDDVLHAAELFHLQFHESNHKRENWSPGVTLKWFESFVELHPNSGLSIGRDHAWGIDAMCAAYSVATPEWRERNREWYSRVARLFLNGAMPSGVLQRRMRADMVDGKYEAAQTYQTLFLLHAQRCINEAVLRGVDDELREELEALCIRTIDYLYFGPIWAKIPLKRGKREVFGGPVWAFAVGLNDNRELPPFSDAEHWGENYLPPDGRQDRVEANYCHYTLEYATRVTGDRKYLRRALECGSGFRSFEALTAKLFADARRPSNDNSANWAGLVGYLQL